MQGNQEAPPNPIYKGRTSEYKKKTKMGQKIRGKEENTDELVKKNPNLAMLYSKPPSHLP